eukprot:scaffold13094_cov124-Isochrysis_galbana.AAC.1
MTPEANIPRQPCPPPHTRSRNAEGATARTSGGLLLLGARAGGGVVYPRQLGAAGEAPVPP